MLKWVTVCLCVCASAHAVETQSDVLVQISRYFDNGNSEQYYVRCPPGSTKQPCDAVKVVNEIETQKGVFRYARAFSVVEQFFSKLPKGDVVGPEEPAGVSRSEGIGVLWQVRLGKRWAKGTINKSELIKPTDLNRKRLQALHGLQWRVLDVLKDI